MTASPELLILLWIVCAGSALGFGLRLGWTLEPHAERWMAYVIAFPIWLVQLVVFHWRRRKRRAS